MNDHHNHATCAHCGDDFKPEDELVKLEKDGKVAVVVRPIAIAESVVHLDVKFMGDLANRIVLRAAEDGMVPQMTVPVLVEFGLNIGNEVHRRRAESEGNE